MSRALFKTHRPRGGEGVSCWGKGNDHRFRGLQTVLPTFFIHQWRLSDTCPPPSDNGLLLTGSQGNGLCCPPFSPPLSQLHPMSAAMEGTSRVSHLRVSVRSTCSPDSPFIAQEGKETWETWGPPPEKEWQLTGTNSEDSLL